MIRICSSAPVAAPLVKPMMSGLPSGLRVSAWKTAPDAPSAAPMVTAHSARASRRSSTTKSVAVVPLPSSDGDDIAGRQREVAEEGSVTASPTPTTAMASSTVTTSGRRVDPQAHRPTRSGGERTAVVRRSCSRAARHSWATRRRRTSAMNTGAPMIAVTMPTLSSPGRTTSRPMMSAPSSRIGASTAV